MSASTLACRLRKDRRVRVPFLPGRHSPAPHSVRPVPSSWHGHGSGAGSRGRHLQRLGPAAQGGGRRSGARSSPGRARAEPISPSVWRRVRRNIACSVNAVLRARAERSSWPPCMLRGLAFPACDLRFGEPDRDAAALALGGVVG